MKRSFRVSVIVNNCDTVFKEGLEPGVLGYEDVEYDLDEAEYEKPIFIAHLMDRREELLSSLLKTEVKQND